jgi:hypothetical protein
MKKVQRRLERRCLGPHTDFEEADPLHRDQPLPMEGVASLEKGSYSTYRPADRSYPHSQRCQSLMGSRSFSKLLESKSPLDPDNRFRKICAPLDCPPFLRRIK